MGELARIFINNIAPILSIAAIGYWAGRALNAPAKPISSMMFHIFSPALVFHSLYYSDIGGGETVQLFALTVLFQFDLRGVQSLHSEERDSRDDELE